MSIKSDDPPPAEDDLVRRLKHCRDYPNMYDWVSHLVHEAADRIAELQAEVKMSHDDHAFVVKERDAAIASEKAMGAMYAEEVKRRDEADQRAERIERETAGGREVSSLSTALLDDRIKEAEEQLRLLKRARRLARRKAALADPAVRAKMSAARKAALADPAVRAKMSAASKAAWADPAVRAKMSAASKAAWADRWDAQMQPERRRHGGGREKLDEIQLDALEELIFGRGRKRA